MNLFNALIKSGHFYGQTNADVEVGIQTRFVITNVFSQTFHICLGEEQVSLAQALAGFGRGYIPGNQPLGKKGKNILNKWIQWAALMYKILWNGQLFSSLIPGRNTNFLKVFLQKAEHYCFTGLCLRRAIKKNQHHALKMRSGELEMPIKARFMHCITGRMFHSWGSASTQPKESQNNLEGSAAVKCNYWAPSLSVLLGEKDKEFFLKITNLVRCHSHSQSIFIY